MYMQYEKCIFLVGYCDFVVNFAKYFVAGINFSTLVQYLQSLCLLNIFTDRDVSKKKLSNLHAA